MAAAVLVHDGQRTSNGTLALAILLAQRQVVFLHVKGQKCDWGYSHLPPINVKALPLPKAFDSYSRAGLRVRQARNLNNTASSRTAGNSAAILEQFLSESSGSAVTLE